MISKSRIAVTCSLLSIAVAGISTASAQEADIDPIRVLVSRLDLESYKSTLKGLTQFGDRRQGPARNRNAVDGIEQQLISAGCDNARRTLDSSFFQSL